MSLNTLHDLPANARAFIAPTPSSFADLMEVYEHNYIALRLFLGEIKELPERQVWLAESAMPFEVEVVEQHAHTTIIKLNYLFTKEQPIHRRPDLLVQVYHDSRQADVISRQCKLDGQDIRRWHDSAPEAMLMCRWRLNRFLYKWLRYLARHNYLPTHAE